jgi:LacI family transcriptional regulator, galactose operon repressor
MDGKFSNYTIKEIAEMAEVSRATVDRVIHGRGVVSKQTEKKIKGLLKKIDYRPNVLAQSLKKGALLKIGVLIPDPAYDVYWKRATQGIDSAIAEYSILGIKIEKFLFNPYRSASFVLNSKHIRKGEYDGIIVAPFFYYESLEFFDECKKAGIPYVTFNTYIKEADPVCFVGQNLIESGRAVASLLDKITDPDKKFLVLHLDEDLANAKHMQEKEEGFINYIKSEGYPPDKVAVYKIASIPEIDKKLGEILESLSHVGGIFVTTSKVHYIADYLKEYKLDLRLIGYDLIEDNVAYLKSGIIDYLLFQNPKLQANKALSALIDHLAFKKELPSRIILPASIVIKENVESYLYDL